MKLYENYPLISTFGMSPQQFPAFCVLHRLIKRVWIILQPRGYPGAGAAAPVPYINNLPRLEVKNFYL